MIFIEKLNVKIGCLIVFKLLRINSYVKKESDISIVNTFAATHIYLIG